MWGVPHRRVCVRCVKQMCVWRLSYEHPCELMTLPVTSNDHQVRLFFNTLNILFSSEFWTEQRLQKGFIFISSRRTHSPWLPLSCFPMIYIRCNRTHKSINATVQNQWRSTVCTNPYWDRLMPLISLRTPLVLTSINELFPKVKPKKGRKRWRIFKRNIYRRGRVSVTESPRSQQRSSARFIQQECQRITRTDTERKLQHPTVLTDSDLRVFSHFTS